MGFNSFENGHLSKKIALNIPSLPYILCCMLFDMIYYYSINLIQQVFIETLRMPDHADYLESAKINI